MPREPDRQLEDLLQQAGRDAQPTAEGWDGLEERLASIPQRERSGDAPSTDRDGMGGGEHTGGRLYIWFSAVTGAAAMIAVMIGIGIYFGVSQQQALAITPAIRVERQDVALTVFNEFEAERPVLYTPQQQVLPQVQQERHVRQQIVAQPVFAQGAAPFHTRAPQPYGMALVKDRRLVFNLQAGENVVRFTDVAATMDPTSVQLVSETDPHGTRVVEQNFEYDLATADALLKRYIDRKITCVDDKGETIEGYLAAYDRGSLILADRVATDGDEESEGEGSNRPATQTINRAQLRAVQLPEMPADLNVMPTLVWTVKTGTPGRHAFVLTYLCGEVKWEANYVALIQAGTRDDGALSDGSDDTLDLQSWVSIDNRSGTTYPKSGIKLMAGDVNRVEDPWAPVPLLNDRLAAISGFYLGFDESSLGVSNRVIEVPVFAEKSFFEYHLYTLNVPSTVRDRQIKQLSLKQVAGIPFVRRYVFDTQLHATRPTVQLVFTNDEDHQLGLPLPKGQVRVMQADGDGDLHLLGRHEIDHTPKNEEMEIPIGQAFDVTGQRRVVNKARPFPERLDNREVLEIEFRMRNHKNTPIQARCVEHLHRGRQCEVTESTAEFTHEDAFTLHFDFELAPDSEKTMRFTLDYEW